MRPEAEHRRAVALLQPRNRRDVGVERRFGGRKQNERRDEPLLIEAGEDVVDCQPFGSGVDGGFNTPQTQRLSEATGSRRRAEPPNAGRGTERGASKRHRTVTSSGDEAGYGRREFRSPFGLPP